jgi:hypothetical protein
MLQARNERWREDRTQNKERAASSASDVGLPRLGRANRRGMLDTTAATGECLPRGGAVLTGWPLPEPLGGPSMGGTLAWPSLGVSSVCPFDLPSGLEVEGEADVCSPHVSEWRESVELVFFFKYGHLWAAHARACHTKSS